MGCLRCGRRRVDPVGGPSTWRRGVLAGEMVLVCPDCQVPDWATDLDACAACGSTLLVKQLGEVVCRACGRAGTPVPRPGAVGAAPPDDSLVDEVAAALDRVLGRD